MIAAFVYNHYVLSAVSGPEVKTTKTIDHVPDQSDYYTTRNDKRDVFKTYLSRNGIIK